MKPEQQLKGTRFKQLNWWVVLNKDTFVLQAQRRIYLKRLASRFTNPIYNSTLPTDQLQADTSEIRFTNRRGVVADVMERATVIHLI